jgi:hypothetical protein
MTKKELRHELAQLRQVSEDWGTKDLLRALFTLGDEAVAEARTERGAMALINLLAEVAHEMLTTHRLITEVNASIVRGLTSQHIGPN